MSKPVLVTSLEIRHPSRLCQVHGTCPSVFALSSVGTRAWLNPDFSKRLALKAFAMAGGAFLLVLGIVFILAGPLLPGVVGQENVSYGWQQTIAQYGEALLIAGVILAPIGGGVLAYGYASNEEHSSAP